MVQILNTQDGTINLVSSEEYIVPQGQLLTSSGNSFEFSGEIGIVLVIEGTVFSGGGDGTSDSGTTDDIEVLIGKTGSVWAWSDGLEFSGTGITVRNLGSIVGAGDSGVEMTGIDSFLSNSGTIEGVGHGVQAENAASIVNSGLIVGERAVDLRGDDTELINSGTIQSPGRFESSSVESAGVYLSFGDGFVIRNTGVISGAEYSIKATEFSNIDARIFNTGTLDGDVFLDAGDQRLVNGGTILGNVETSGGADTVSNSSEIIGDLLLGINGDVYNGKGAGVVTGTIDGQDGTDRIYGGDMGNTILGGLDDDTIQGGAGRDDLRGGQDNDVIHGFAGEDTIFGNAGLDDIMGGTGDDLIYGNGSNDTIGGGDGQDTVFGNNGDDSILGGAGNDRLSGDNADDTLRGGDGGDELRGGGDNDRLFGNLGDDVLRGQTGDDALFGGGGNDTLIGGTGVDEMDGEGGADIFIFNAASESGTTNPTADSILGFEIGQDVIDLSALTASEIDFIGTNAFGGGTAELRLIEVAAGDTLVDVDTNGDQVADIRVRVLGVQGLTEDDFIL